MLSPNVLHQDEGAVYMTLDAQSHVDRRDNIFSESCFPSSSSPCASPPLRRLLPGALALSLNLTMANRDGKATPVPSLPALVPAAARSGESL